MRARLVSTSITLGLLITLVAGVGTSASAEPGTPYIDGIAVENAPVNRNGAIYEVSGGCRGGDRLLRSVQTTIENLTTGRSQTYDLLALGKTQFRRPAGDYRITTTAKCRKFPAKTRVQTVTIEQKTDATTMSRREYRQIECGMTRKQVTAIVGYPGEIEPGVPAGGFRTYQPMPIFSDASVLFDHRRVQWKSFGSFRPGSEPVYKFCS